MDLGLVSSACPFPQRRRLTLSSPERSLARVAFQERRIAYRRSVAETDDSRLQGGYQTNGLAILCRVRRKEFGRLPQARLAGEEIDVGQHVAGDQHPVRLAKKHNMTRGVAGRVDDAKARDLVPLAQDAADPMRGPGPQTMAQAHDAAYLVLLLVLAVADWKRGRLAFYDPVQLRSLIVSIAPLLVLVVGMTMGQGHHA